MGNEESIPPINSSEDYDKLTPEQKAEVDSWGSEDLDLRLTYVLQNIEVEELAEDKITPDKDDRIGAE